MAKPLVAIVGRPNVGKSTLFNKLSGRRISIVENRPGITRDRIYADAEWLTHRFSVVDTGGLELKSDDDMWKHIKKQADVAIETADVIIFVCDAKSGVTASDSDVAQMLRHSCKPVVLAVNKMDAYNPSALAEFYGLGLGEPFGISAEQSVGIGDLLDEVCSHFPAAAEEEEEESAVRIAIVGKPNVGKSSLLNRLIGAERAIVSDVAGTTRDAVDTAITFGGKKYILVDTAGLRRKRSVSEDVEYYSVVRTLASIRRADVVLAVIDATEGMSEQDVKICGYIHEQGKPSVIVVNKWDAVEKDNSTVKKFEDKLKTQLSFMDYYKSLYVSAKTGQRTDRIFSAVDLVLSHASFRVQTGALNDVVCDAVRTTEPPTKNGRRLKIYFSVQDGICPPTFVFFVNDEQLMHFSYKRFLENYLRNTFDFTGTPLRLVVRKRESEE